MLHDSAHRRDRIAVDRLFYTAVLLIVLAVWTFPLVLTVMTSLKSDADVLAGPLGLPQHPTLEAYFQVWKLLDFGLLLRNSFAIALGGSALAIVLGSLPAFALSRFRIRGGEVIFVLLLTTMMLPQQTVVIPTYEVLRRLGLTDSLFGLALVHGVHGMPFIMLILRGFMVSIPEDLVSAARVDGCSDFGVFRNLILPLVVPAVSVAGTLNILGIWKEFFFALIFLNSNSNLPVTVGLLQVTQSMYFSAWNLPAAALLMAQLPMVVLYVVTYRWITQGIYAGGVKG